MQTSPCISRLPVHRHVLIYRLCERCSCFMLSHIEMDCYVVEVD